MGIISALRTIMKQDSKKGNMAYAQAYARELLNMLANHCKDINMLDIQANYVLCNLTYWRGDEAKQVKACIKHWQSWLKGEAAF